MRARLPGTARTTGSRLAVAALLAVAAVVVPANAGSSPVSAADPIAPAPLLFVDDAPFTRNPEVKLGFVTYVDGQPNGGPVARWVASNDSATSDGVLVNGVDVVEYAWWTPAAGPDGARTIYGQVQYTSGMWSPVASIDVVVDTDPMSSTAVDVDYRTMYWAPEWTDWHTTSSTPSARILAEGSRPTSPTPDTLSVSDPQWGVTFATPGVPIDEGAHTITSPAGEQCGSTCAIVGVVGGSSLASCMATGGTFTIRDLVLTPEGDIDVLDADFSLECDAEHYMSGSIRYGSARGIRTLDQDVDALYYPRTLLDTEAAPQAVTFTNAGKTSYVQFGAARLTGTEAADFDITGDTCSQGAIAVGETCTVEVTFTASAIGQRRAFLEIPDSTPGSRRRVMVQGYGEVQSMVQVSVAAPEFGPAPATVQLTVTPPEAPGPYHWIDGEAQYLGPCTETNPDPGHRVYTCHPDLGPGRHTITASVRADGWYLASTEDSVEVDVGTATSLQLATVTDDGIADGESATVRATLTTGGPLDGGTLRIRDGLTDAILATSEATGTSPHLDLQVTRATGTHPFIAEFVPASPEVQASEDAYDLVVVPGPRPQTVMDGSTLITSRFTTTSTFSSPDAGVSFQCSVGPANWYACSSPALFQYNNPGTQQLVVRAVRANGLADRTPATRTWIIDASPPAAGVITINGGAAYTRSRYVTVGITGGSDNASLQGVGLSNGEYSAYEVAPQTASRSWTLAPGDGTKTVHGKWFDSVGYSSDTVSDSIVLDATPPSATGPKPALMSGSSANANGVAVRIQWTGSDATSGIARFELARSRDGGAWVTVSTSLTAAHTKRRLDPGHSYRFMVRAVDRAGNTGAWVEGPRFRLSAVQEDVSGIRYSGTWRTGTSSSYWGGRARHSGATGATARITVSARTFAWVAATGPGRGSAKVYIDGTLVATVNLQSPTAHARRVVFSRSWSTAAPRTVVIRVIGTSGHPRVDLDAFTWAS